MNFIDLENLKCDVAPATSCKTGINRSAGILFQDKTRLSSCKAHRAGVVGRRLRFQQAEHLAKKCPVASEVTHAHAHPDLNDSRIAGWPQTNGVPVRIVKPSGADDFRFRYNQLSVSARRFCSYAGRMSVHLDD